MQIGDEMVEKAAKIVCAWLNTSWDGLSDRDISDKFPDWAYPVYGPSLQGGKPALRKIMRAALEAALGARPKCDSDLLKHLRVTAELTAQGMKNSKPEDYLEGKAAACIEDLAVALKKLKACIRRHPSGYDWQPYFDLEPNSQLHKTSEAVFNLDETLERWGLK